MMPGRSAALAVPMAGAGMGAGADWSGVKFCTAAGCRCGLASCAVASLDSSSVGASTSS